MAKLIIPFLNPIKFVIDGNTNLPQYATKHFDDFIFQEQILDWEQPTNYCIKYSTSDIIKLQFHCDSDPVVLIVLDENNEVVTTSTLNWILRNKYDTSMFVYEASISLNSFTAGRYRIKLEVGTAVAISEWIQVLDDISNTILLEYNNTKFYGNVMFETGIVFGFRVEGSIGKMIPKSKDSLYEDEVLNQTILNSRPFRLFKLSIGGTFGIPDWVADRLNWILGCNNIAIDGKYFCKSDGANLEPKEEENYPLRGYLIDMRESIRRDSFILQGTVNTNKKLVIISNIDSKGFGNLANASNDVVSIIDIE